VAALSLQGDMKKRGERSLETKKINRGGNGKRGQQALRAPQELTERGCGAGGAAAEQLAKKKKRRSWWGKRATRNEKNDQCNSRISARPNYWGAGTVDRTHGIPKRQGRGKGGN